MPYVNCSVPLCVASTRKTPNLKFYRLPIDGKRRAKWIQLMGNSNLTLESASFWTSICGLHFIKRPGVVINLTPKTSPTSPPPQLVDDLDPSLFPWSRDWPDLIRKYNDAQLGQTLPILTPDSIGSNVGLGFDTGIAVSKHNSDIKEEGGSKNVTFYSRDGILIECLKLEEDNDPTAEPLRPAPAPRPHRQHTPTITSTSFTRPQMNGVMPQPLLPLTRATGTSLLVSATMTPVTEIMPKGAGFQKGGVMIQPNPLVPLTQTNGPLASLVPSVPQSVITSHHDPNNCLFFNPYQSSQLLSRLTELWRLGRMCDAALCVGNTVRMNAHRLVLASVSSTILDMANVDGNFLEIQLPDDMNVEAVHKFLTYIYEGVLYISPSTVRDIERIGRILNVDSVIGYCNDFRRQVNILKQKTGHEVPYVTTIPSSNVKLKQALVNSKPVLATKTLSTTKPMLSTTTSTKHTPTVKPFTLTKTTSSLAKRRDSLKTRQDRNRKLSKFSSIKKWRVPNGKALEKFLETNPCLKMQTVSSISNEEGDNLPSLTQVDESHDEHLTLISKLLSADENPVPTQLFKSLTPNSNVDSVQFNDRASPLPTVQNLINLSELTRIKVEPEDDPVEMMDMNGGPVSGLSFSPVYPQFVVPDTSDNADYTLTYSAMNSSAKNAPITVTMSRRDSAITRLLLSEVSLADIPPINQAEMEAETTKPWTMTGDKSNIDTSYQFLPIPDDFLNDLSTEQQRRYMASILERPNISTIPETRRQYMCTICPTSFVKAKSCVGHVIESHSILSKDVLHSINIDERYPKVTKVDTKLTGLVTSSGDNTPTVVYYGGNNVFTTNGNKSKTRVKTPEHVCIICKKTFNSKKQLLQHIECHEMLVNVCKFCDFQKFRSTRSLQMHFRTMHLTYIDGGRECLECGEFISDDKIIEHFQDHPPRPTVDESKTESQSVNSSETIDAKSQSIRIKLRKKLTDTTHNEFETLPLPVDISDIKSENDDYSTENTTNVNYAMETFDKDPTRNSVKRSRRKSSEKSRKVPLILHGSKKRKGKSRKITVANDSDDVGDEDNMVEYDTELEPGEINRRDGFKNMYFKDFKKVTE